MSWAQLATAQTFRRMLQRDPFSNDYQPKVNVPVAKCSTAYTGPNSGHSVLLVADQVLWFGTNLHCSLINPHQIRSYGHSLCDDPWDPHRPIGLDVEVLFVPFQSAGPNLFFETRVPTDWEMDNLQVVDITGPHWDPYDIRLPQRVPFVDHRNMSTATLDLAESASVLSQISASFDFRRLSALYSSCVAVSAAPTGTTRAIAAAVTGERHSSVTPENLSRKWCIGIETAKRTLQVTTQRGVRTAIHPLHRRYRVNHLHLNRRRLNGDWFTDTLFSKVISIQGNTCAQVFTNGSFTTVHRWRRSPKLVNH